MHYIREPFVWDMDTTDAMQTFWEAPKYSTDQTVIPLSVQTNDPGSLYSFYKNLIHYRNASKALTFGDMVSTDFRIHEVVSFKRFYEGEQLLVLNNVSDVEVTIDLSENDTMFDDLDYDSNGTAELSDGTLTLPAFTTVILK